MKLPIAAALTLALFTSLNAVAADDLEDALVIGRPEIFRPLEAKGFSLADLISTKPGAGILDNKAIADVPAYGAVLENLRKEMADYRKKNPKYGVGLEFGGRLFDLDYLVNPRARFALVGVTNRMDTGYKTGNRCGEVRFIYRLAYNVIDHGKPVTSRLPMTINLVFHGGLNDDPAHCTELAKEWLKVTPKTTPEELTTTGPLSARFFRRENVKALELNLQIVRLAAAVRPDFGGHAEYLLKVYKWQGDTFAETTLENQIDRPRLLADKALYAELKAWLFDPTNVRAIDQGTHLIPEKFLAKSALSIAPGGITRSGNRQFYSFITGDEIDKINFAPLENIKSPVAFLRRLNDSTCIGCHQTRAIGGFHFTGRDPFGKYPGNSVFLPGSAHFMGELARRKVVLQEIAAGGAVDYSRGFSARPQTRRAGKTLDGSGLYNGWGAHCATGDDPSFKGWTCAAGLKCKSLLDKQDGLGSGICLPETQQVGDPCESGIIKTKEFGNDVYERSGERAAVTVKDALCSPQSQAPGTSSGGFLNGNVRTRSCANLPKEASCGPLPAARPGFNACLTQKNFGDCLKEYAVGVGLRGCDQRNPCRDDYICAESFETGRGSCVPPYFMFQFRVDGHPKGT